MELYPIQTFPMAPLSFGSCHVDVFATEACPDAQADKLESLLTSVDLCAVQEVSEDMICRICPALSKAGLQWHFSAYGNRNAHYVGTLTVWRSEKLTLKTMHTCVPNGPHAGAPESVVKAQIVQFECNANSMVTLVNYRLPRCAVDECAYIKSAMQGVDTDAHPILLCVSGARNNNNLRAGMLLQGMTDICISGDAYDVCEGGLVFTQSMATSLKFQDVTNSEEHCMSTMMGSLDL